MSVIEIKNRGKRRGMRLGVGVGCIGMTMMVFSPLWVAVVGIAVMIGGGLVFAKVEGTA
jgi:hypothetical protein